jgi:hypothetical protein
MKKRFVVMIGSGGGTKDEEREFISYLEESSLGYWHWIHGCWLLVGSNTNLLAGDIRDAVSKIFHQKRSLVLQINKDSDTWSGRGPGGTNKNMFQWLHKNWNDE